MKIYLHFYFKYFSNMQNHASHFLVFRDVVIFAGHRYERRWYDVSIIENLLHIRPGEQKCFTREGHTCSQVVVFGRLFHKIGRCLPQDTCAHTMETHTLRALALRRCFRLWAVYRGVEVGALSLFAQFGWLSADPGQIVPAFLTCSGDRAFFFIGRERSGKAEPEKRDGK